MEELVKIHWHANTSSGGTLSLSLTVEGDASQRDKESFLAEGIQQCHEFMEEKGYIPHQARLMSSRDIAQEYGKSRQYWEKLLNEGKILYKETSAGRITTDIWIEGYLGNKEQVDKYARCVRAALKAISTSNRSNGSVACPVCGEERLEFYVNISGSTNGICRACSFHIHTTN